LTHPQFCRIMVDILNDGRVTLAKKGAVVAGVIPGSIGEEMGIEPGDRVVSINGKG
jgi:S1-C subfamily serine protease